MSKLTEFIDSDNAIVYTWNARTALVRIEGWVCTLVPSEGEEGRELPSAVRALQQPLVEAPPERRTFMRLGELACWASRLAPKTWSIVYGDVRRDPQAVLGCVYDRVAIRQSLQWLLQRRVPADALVWLETVRVPDTAEGVCVLRMRCDDWMGLVMCHVPGSAHGDDPLFTDEVSP